MSDKGGGGGEQPDDSQKTEEPTAKKLKESREQGQVPLSREFNTWLMLLTGTLVLLFAGPSMMEGIALYFGGMLANSGTIVVQDIRDVSSIMTDATLEMIRLLTIPFIAFIAAALFGTVVQIGFLMSPESIKPSLEKIDLIKGVQRMFSMKSFMEFAKGVMKIVIIAVVSVVVLKPVLPTIDIHIGQSVMEGMHDVQYIAARLLTAILVALFLIALVDIIFVRMDFHKRMKMTRQEIKDEYKQAEGDPHVKARLRQLRAERARQRMIQAVPEADVVITNPTHFAVALKYDSAKMDAPTVVAKGTDKVAARIREIADEHGVPLYPNPPLARSLFATVDIDETIPEELYKAVAEAISYVLKVKGKLKSSFAMKQ